MKSFASSIDGEGRCILKCGTLQDCKEVKRVVELMTRQRGLKIWVKLIHNYVVAHQMLAMTLISWLDGTLSYCEGFRSIFSEVMVKKEFGSNGEQMSSILEGMLRRDTVLWKAARSAIHHLLISGMLLEHASKKEFATIFTNIYGAM